MNLFIDSSPNSLMDGSLGQVEDEVKTKSLTLVPSDSVTEEAIGWL